MNDGFLEKQTNHSYTNYSSNTELQIYNDIERNDDYT